MSTRRQRQLKHDMGMHPGDNTKLKEMKNRNSLNLLNRIKNSEVQMPRNTNSEPLFQNPPFSTPTNSESILRDNYREESPIGGGGDSDESFSEREYPPTRYDPFSHQNSSGNTTTSSYFCDENDPLQNDFGDVHLTERERKDFLLRKKSSVDNNLNLKSEVYHLSKYVLQNVDDYEEVFGKSNSLPFLPLDQRTYGNSGNLLFEGSEFRVRDLHLILSLFHTQKGIPRNGLNAIIGMVNLLFGRMGVRVPQTFESLERSCQSLTSRIRVVPYCPFCQAYIVRNLKSYICEECEQAVGRRLPTGKIEWFGKLYTHWFPQLVTDYIHNDDLFRKYLKNLATNLEYLEWVDSRFGEKVKKVFQDSDDIEKYLFMVVTLSADKVSLFKSGIKKSVKPYSFQFDNLPKKIRFRFHYIFMLLLVPPQEDSKYQLKNPNIPIFVLVVQWFSIRRKKFFGGLSLKNFLRSTVYDSPEAAEQVCVKQYNAECGCYKCRLKGEPLPAEEGSSAPPRYELGDGPWIQKDLYQAIYSFDKLEKEKRRGLKEKPCLSYLFELFTEIDLEYDYLKSNTTDTMHAIINLFGVTDVLLNKPFKEQVDEFVGEIKYLREGGRRLRSVVSSKSWKYQEKLNFFLFYFSLFVDISSVNLPQRDDVQFVANKIREVIVEIKKGVKGDAERIHSLFKELKIGLMKFPEYKVSMSNHILFEHTADNQKETGPHLGKSAEGFESFYSVMRRVKGKKNVSESIMKIVLTIYENHLSSLSFPKKYPDSMKVYLNKHFDLKLPKEKFNDESLCIYQNFLLPCEVEFTSKKPGSVVQDDELLNFIRQELKVPKVSQLIEYDCVQHPTLKCPIDTTQNSRVSKSSNSLVFLNRNSSENPNVTSLSSCRNVRDFNSKYCILRIRKILEVTYQKENENYFRTSCVLVGSKYQVIGLKKNSNTLVVDQRLDMNTRSVFPLETIKCHAVLVPEVRNEYLVEVAQGVQRSAEINSYNHKVAYVIIMFGY